MQRLTLGATLVALAPLAQAQTITTVVKEGDAIPGKGNVTVVYGLAVDDTGEVLVHVITDIADPAIDAGLIDASLTPVVWEGDAVAAPGGATVGTFNGGEYVVNGAGVPAYYLGLNGTTGAGDDSGIYFKTSLDLVAQEGAVSPAPELPAGTKYEFPLTPRINDTGGVAFKSRVDDPNIAGTADYSALFVVDTTTGAHSAPYIEGDTIPGQTSPIKELAGDFYNLAYNDAGDLFFGCQLNTGARALFLNDTRIAMTGELSPFGPTYANLATSLHALDVNDEGSHVFSTNLGDSGKAIVLNGEGFIRTGGTFPSIAPHNLSSIGQVVLLGNDDTVAWMGQWNVPDLPEGHGLFVDYSLVVQEGVTEIGGLVVEDLPGLDRTLALSDSGQYLLFEAVLAGGVEGAFLIDLWN